MIGAGEEVAEDRPKRRYLLFQREDFMLEFLFPERKFRRFYVS